MPAHSFAGFTVPCRTCAYETVRTTTNPKTGTTWKELKCRVCHKTRFVKQEPVATEAR